MIQDSMFILISFIYYYPYLFFPIKISKSAIYIELSIIINNKPFNSILHLDLFIMFYN